MKLVALKGFKFDGKQIGRDQTFEATNTYGKILIARGSAEAVKEPTPERKRKGQYSRRDMVAEERTGPTGESGPIGPSDDQIIDERETK